MDEKMNMYYIAKDQEVTGPFAEDQLIAMWRSGQISADSHVCPQGTQNWKLAIVFLGAMDKMKANLEVLPARRSKRADWEMESLKTEPKKSYWFFKTCLVILVMVAGGIFVVKNAQKVAREKQVKMVDE